jgi:hypothetical protein
MKLRKQAPAKALLVALSAGLLALFYAIVRANSGLEAESGPDGPAVDYQRFFAPQAQPASSAPVAPAPIEPRGRTRAS